MEREHWLRLRDWLARRFTPARSRRFHFSDVLIASVYGWANVHDRPVCWACQARHWPADLRPARLPSPATMSRRLRQPMLVELLERALRQLGRGQTRGLLSAIDGKPLPVSAHSKDPDATWGRGAGGRAKGYKLHAIAGKNGRLEAWRIEPLHRDERTVARQLLRQARLQGYLLADRNYDANHLYEACRTRGVQLLTPRRYGPQRGTGHRRQSPARLRAKDALEQSHTGFGPTLFAQRPFIERYWGQLTSVPYGLHALPPWVRRLPRVRLWVQMKMLIFALAQRRKTVI